MEGYVLAPTGIAQPPPVEKVPHAKGVTQPRKVAREGRREERRDTTGDQGGAQDGGQEGEKTPQKDQGRLLDVLV